MAFFGEKGSAAAEGAAFRCLGALATVIAVAYADAVGSATAFGIVHTVVGVAKHIGDGVRHGVSLPAMLIAVGDTAGVGVLPGAQTRNGNVLLATKTAAVVAAFFYGAF